MAVNFKGMTQNTLYSALLAATYISTDDIKIDLLTRKSWFTDRNPVHT